MYNLKKVFMKNLANYCTITSNLRDDVIEMLNVPQGCNLVVIKSENSVLTHFYLLQGKKYVRAASERCMSLAVECKGRVLQINFNKFSALFFAKQNKLVSLGCSFKKVEYVENGSSVHINAISEIVVGALVEEGAVEASAKTIYNKPRVVEATKTFVCNFKSNQLKEL